MGITKGGSIKNVWKTEKAYCRWMLSNKERHMVAALGEGYQKSVK